MWTYLHTVPLLESLLGIFFLIPQLLGQVMLVQLSRTSEARDLYLYFVSGFFLELTQCSESEYLKVGDIADDWDMEKS